MIFEMIANHFVRCIKINFGITKLIIVRMTLRASKYSVGMPLSLKASQIMKAD